MCVLYPLFTGLTFHFLDNQRNNWLPNKVQNVSLLERSFLFRERRTGRIFNLKVMEDSPKKVKKKIITFPIYLFDCHSFFHFPIKLTFRRIPLFFFRVSRGQWRKQIRCFLPLSTAVFEIFTCLSRSIKKKILNN